LSEEQVAIIGDRPPQQIGQSELFAI